MQIQGDQTSDKPGSLGTVTRRHGVMGGARAALALAAASTITMVGPIATLAYAAEKTGVKADRAKLRTGIVGQAADLVTQFRQQEAIDLLLPFAGDNDPDVFAGIAAAFSRFANAPNKIKAVEWITRAIELKPTSTTYLASRAGYYGDAGYRYDEQRLGDRSRVVELAEAASPKKSASAGNYSDLAGAHNAFVTPRGGGAVDEKRRDLVMQLRSRAVAIGESYGRLLDRAEFVNSRYNNPGMGRDDVTRAMLLVETRMDESQPSTWYAMGQLRRRIAELPAKMSLLGATITVPGERSEPFRPSQAAVRAQAVDAYQHYIDMWEQSGRDFLKFGNGHDALNNQATVLRKLGGNQLHKAVENYDKLIAINPTNPGYWRNKSIALDALGERGAARDGYQKYLELNGTEDDGNVGATLARLAQG